MTRRINDLGLITALRIHGITPTSTQREALPRHPDLKNTMFYYEDTEELRSVIDSYQSGALEGSLSNFHAILRTIMHQVREARRAVHHEPR